MNNLQKERKLHIGWVATIAILVVSSITSVLFVTSQVDKIYTLRDSNFGLFNDSYSNNVYYTTSNNSVSNESSTQINNLANNNINTLNANTYNSSNGQHSPNNIANQTNINLFAINGQAKLTKENNTHFNPQIGVQIIEEEINKIKANSESSSYSASYKNNPSFIPNRSVTKSKKSKSNYGSIGYKIKKAFKKIEKISGYPVGLTNLKDPDLLIPNSNLLDFNGGFVGGYGSERLEMRYRNQWLGESSNLQSAHLNFDTYSKSLRGGLGLTFNSNNFNNGTYTDNRVSFFYSPKFALTSKIYFEPAIKMTLGLMTLNNSKVISNNELEIGRGRVISNLPANDISYANNLWYKDYGVGFVLNADKFFIGFNANNLSQHNQSVYGQNENAPIEYSAIIGMDYQSRNKKTVLSPFMSYYNNNSLNELWGGLNIKYRSMTIGGAYSSNNEYSASIGMKFKTFKMIYQYDMTKSHLNNAKFGSHTVGIRINTKRKKIR